MVRHDADALHYLPQRPTDIITAFKYRHMLAVMEGVEFEECRAVLAAYQLAPGIKKLCDRYGVQAIEVKREAVERWVASRGGSAAVMAGSSNRAT